MADKKQKSPKTETLLQEPKTTKEAELARERAKAAAYAGKAGTNGK